MNVQRWIARREPSWQQFDALLRQAEKQGIRSLQTDQVKALASLYRSVSADLARARTQQVGDGLVRELQLLATRGYGQIYQGSRRQNWRAAIEFYQYGFPAAVRQAWGYITAATLTFILSGLVGWWYSWQDPAFLSLVLDPGFVAQVRETRELWTVSILGNEPVVSSALMINNISVALRAIFGGVAFLIPTVPVITPPGVFTLFVLALNGLMIGAVATLVAQTDLAYELWAFVSPHGALELPAIFFAGGAGLILARGILLPGRYRRADALRVYGLQAARLVYGIVPMLVIAGVIEAFFSPSPAIPAPVKYATGAAIFAGLVAYCLRRSPVQPPNPSSPTASSPSAATARAQKSARP